MKTTLIILLSLLFTTPLWAQESTSGNSSDTSTYELKFQNKADKYLECGTTSNGINMSISTPMSFTKKAEKALLAPRKGFHLSFGKNGVGLAYNLGSRQ